MYEQILEEVSQAYYQEHFPNQGQRFVAWYLRNIHLRDLNQTRDDITDGSDDKKIDAIVVDDDKSTIFVVQGKFIGASTVDAHIISEKCATIAWSKQSQQGHQSHDLR